MNLRSIFFVSVDGEEKLARSADRPADAILLDCDSVVQNGAFTPAAAELDQALRIAAVRPPRADFGAFQFDGDHIDLPHLRQAERLLALGEELRAA